MVHQTGILDLCDELLDMVLARMDAESRRRFRATSVRHRDAVDRGVRAAAVPYRRQLITRNGARGPYGSPRLVLRRWAGLHTLSLHRLGRVRVDWFAGLPGLRHLSLALCGGLGAAECAALARAECWPRLETLDISDNAIGDAGLLELAAAPAPRLSRLALRQDPADSVGALTSISSIAVAARDNWPGLRHLSLRGQWLLGARGLAAFEAAFPALESLDVSGCLSTNDLGAHLRALARTLPRLRTLYFENPSA